MRRDIHILSLYQRRCPAENETAYQAFTFTIPVNCYEIVIPKEQRDIAAQEGINTENEQNVTVIIMNLNTGESYTGRLAITGNRQPRLPLQGTSGQVYLPTEIQQMLNDSKKIRIQILGG